MPNSYFQFKNFTIQQGMCGMKVTTEGCLLGAWIPVETANSLLDIGTGTGLLPLMCAQRGTMPVTAIEIDQDACVQADENFQNSPWRDRLSVIHSPVQTFADSTKQTFDLIVCNPPFFTNNLKPSDPKRNMALHTDTLPMADLIQAIAALLSDTGSAYVLYPVHESAKFEQLALQQGLYACEKLEIINNPGQKPFRMIQGFKKTPETLSTNSLVIRDGDGHYSDQFTQLLSPYYLGL
ncbi:MAG: methyltransferase [Cyclobacteriaceae bacterium]|nr:methyltransferase [Cyclobacteriaceae bacterium]